MRNHYWSCSKLADRIRGIAKIKAGTAEEWDDWGRRAKSHYPVRWWVAEEGLDILQKIVYWPTDTLYNIKYYINNRFVTHTHRLTAHPRNIKPGNWCDLGDRFLPCLFNELVNFVEIETAWKHAAWDKSVREKYNVPFWAIGWFRWRTWRCPQAGIDHLNWEMTLTDEEWLPDNEKHKAKPTHQAVTAKQILELYKWWTEIYPNRPDPYVASGWSAHCDAMRLKNPGGSFLGLSAKDKADKAASNKAFTLLRKIEAQYEKEDTNMLKRLIEVRKSLWT